MTLGGQKKTLQKKKKTKREKGKIEDSRKQAQNSTTFPRRSKNERQDNNYKIKLNFAGRERSVTTDNERQSFFSKYAITACILDTV